MNVQQSCAVVGNRISVTVCRNNKDKNNIIRIRLNNQYHRHGHGRGHQALPKLGCTCSTFCYSCSSAVPTDQVNKLKSELKSQQTLGAVKYDSLRVLEWDKLCDSVASFASTSLGRQATQAQLWCVNQSYEESLMLLKETNAAIEMHKHGVCLLDFTSIDLLLVKTAIQRARRGLTVNANEAMAVATLLHHAHVLHLNLKATINQDVDWYKRFMPLSQLIMEFVINQTLVRTIKRVIDEDGSVKDSASFALKQSRDQLQTIEKKLSQLMDALIRNEMKDSSFLEVSIVNGRWSIKSGTDQLTNIKGLMLSSDSGMGSIVEPLSAVSLNDELQRARASVAKAEADVLLMLTEKMQADVDDIEKVSNSVIRLDVINARATYSLSFGGACPDLYLADRTGRSSIKREWILYMPKAYHPLLLQQHRQSLQKMQKDAGASNAVAETKRSLQWDNGTLIGETDADLSSLEMQVFALEQAHPVPVDFLIAHKTKVLIITGPNTGGKTICLKTVGLAAMMAKSGLYVFSSESVQIPWFDSIFADIGDEQSLSQSLSTFSGHLKQISDIRSHSTSQSLVLLDEVGAGTNPLEGAALGMSVLESFADGGTLLAIATTHHGELKSLKYSNDAFENASMEFDEVNLKPTYKILWGVPGRSNAINISEKLGLPSVVVSNARELYGAASAEINEVIVDMERFKQDFQELVYEAQHHLMLSRNLHEKLLLARRKIMEHVTSQRYKNIQEISKAASMVRSILRKKVRQCRAYATQATQPSQPTMADKRQLLRSDSQCTTENNSRHPTASRSSSAIEIRKKSPSVRRTELPEVGDAVQVSSLRRKATVLRVDPSKDEVVVQAGSMKLKVKLIDIEA